MTSLYHCIYASAATRRFDTTDLASLLQQSRAANALIGVTGMLVYADGSFFQVIEGEEHTIDALITRISADRRHDRLTIIIREPIPKRAFAHWTMGFAALDLDDIGLVEGLNDFFAQQSCLASIDAGRARKLLARFASGRWRSGTRTSPEGAHL